MLIPYKSQFGVRVDILVDEDIDSHYAAICIVLVIKSLGLDDGRNLAADGC